MRRPQLIDCDITVVVRTCDDEERVGHVIARIVRHLRSQMLTSEILIADEGSGDNTIAMAALLRTTVPELEFMHADPQHGYRVACERARGRTIMLYDARSDAPLAPLGFALERLRAGLDVVAVGGRYLVFRRTTSWRAFDALIHRRDHQQLERRFLKRAIGLGLSCTVTHPRRTKPWAFLRRTFFLPLAVRS
jgi:hypothetical protein